MTGTNLFLIANLFAIAVALIWGVNRIFSYHSEQKRKQYEQAAREITVKDSTLRTLTTPQASESHSTGDHDLESYKDLSGVKFRRLSDAELDELGGALTSHQLKKIGG